MTDKPKEKPDPQRVAVLRRLPLAIKQQITGEEADAFMYNKELPQSLLEKLKDYLDLCKELQMDALVEIHSEKDMEKATRAGAKLIGINNRNLRSFETDIHTSIRMKSLLEPDQVAVAASGIRSRKDIENMNSSGIWNFLIGESLVRSDNPGAFLKSLLGEDSPENTP